ncbi:NAD(P)-binding protein [Suhomyces tanzawaensis NRRL Y-17324]|uniref:Short-chain dehydrogenase/reductase 3 n=1 Tax=Suhomyces tanzawaensis NRRL Y-17324 TaxID=984487 RepID=A0A1E4SRZ3_9ASCO|nr:NAD(P)-binding protein [Suhomyces tanzawaensis NRRL Y-17324]ODV82278.1 NAD(P)-binding protein [Suhomyces tanzawaensis NRRL Y-17324]
MGAFLYRYNKQLRDVSDALMGNYFEAGRDIVLVTGGVSGLGREIVGKFAAKKARVIVLDIQSPTMEDRVENVHYYQCDVGNRNQLIEIHKKVIQEVGKPTVLINNAGIARGKSLVELEYAEIEQMIHTNLLASFYTIKLLLPDMLEQKRGYIVTIASVLGYMCPARLSVYGASKSGLIALHEALTYELGSPSWNKTGVKTLLVCPGQLKTNMFEGVVTPTKLLAPELDPAYVAERIYSAMEVGRKGDIKLPLYANLIPIFRALPWFFADGARKLSGIDKSVANFKGVLNRATNIVSLGRKVNGPRDTADIAE